MNYNYFYLKPVMSFGNDNFFIFYKSAINGNKLLKFELQFGVERENGERRKDHKLLC